MIRRSTTCTKTSPSVKRSYSIKRLTRFLWRWLFVAAAWNLSSPTITFAIDSSLRSSRAFPTESEMLRYISLQTLCKGNAICNGGEGFVWLTSMIICSEKKEKYYFVPKILSTRRSTVHRSFTPSIKNAYHGGGIIIIKSGYGRYVKHKIKKWK